MIGANYFSDSYDAARQRFIEVAGPAAASLDSHVLQATGPRREPLSIDVATLGPTQARHVVVLTSGLHGVEGFFGSAVQLAWLEQFTKTRTLPPDTKVILIHGLNPFGFAWRRRWNENNVDLNRNFVTDRTFLESDTHQKSKAAYDRLSSFLNPTSAPSSWEAYKLKAVWRILTEGWAARRRLPASDRPSRFSLSAIKALGLGELQKTLPVGQYHHTSGLFYGGNGPEETTRFVMERLPKLTEDADLTVHLDFHTGLGAFGDYKLLLIEPRHGPRGRWAAEKFGDEFIEGLDERIAFVANGTMAGWLQERDKSYHCITVEFGTYPGIRVLGALRAENRAHFFAKPGTKSYEWAKRQILEAFVPASPRWRQMVIEKSLALIVRSMQVMQ